jgi:hypothetical protein
MATPGLSEAGNAQLDGHTGLARSRDSEAQWIHIGPDNVHALGANF